MPGVQARSVRRARAGALLSAPSGIAAIPASALPFLSRHLGYWSTQSGALAPIGVWPPKFQMLPKAYGVPPQSLSRSVTVV